MLTRRVIAHRLRVDPPPRPRPEAHWAADDSRLIDLGVQALRPGAAKEVIEKLGGRSFGVELTDRFAAVFSDARLSQRLVFNRELVADWSAATRRPLICAVLTLSHPRTKAVAVRQVILSSPQDGKAAMQGFRPDGELWLDGYGAPTAGGFSFEMTSVDGPGRCRYRIGAEIDEHGLRWKRCEFSPTRTSTRSTVPAVPD